jgi:DNA primase
MAFAPQFLDDIRSRVTLSDVIARRVKLIRRGREHTGLCPFHNEKTPSFTVNDDKGFFHCFGCGAHGDVIGFVMRTEGLSFPEAVERLAGEAGLQVPVASPEERVRAKARETLHGVNEAACVWFERQLRAPAGRAALDYLKGRGLGDETIARFRLGFAPEGRDALKAALMKEGLSEALLLEAGLIGRPDDGRAAYDRFRGRVMFPIADRGGRVIAFGGRIMAGGAHGAPPTGAPRKEAAPHGAAGGQPKYLNSPDTPLFNKGHVLYGLAAAREAIHKAQEAIVVEGYMDVIALHQAGIRTAVAPLGTALTEQQIELLWRMAPEPILCFDGDNAGRRAAQRAAERALPMLKPGHSLRFALLPGGDDPDSLVRNGGAAAMREVLAQVRPLVDLIWEMAAVGRPSDTPERRALVRKELRDQAGRIADRSVQDFYWAEFETRLQAAFGRPARDERSFGGRRPVASGQRRWSGRPANREPADSGLRSDGNVAVLDLRRQQALLAGLVNFPLLLADFGEKVGQIGLERADLDNLRQEILNVWAPDLDTGALQRHLRSQGFANVLDRVLAQDVYEIAPFCRPSAAYDVVREGWSDLYDFFYRRQYAGKELEAARRALAEDVSERNWAYLEALQRHLSAGDDEAETTGNVNGALNS